MRKLASLILCASALSALALLSFPTRAAEADIQVRQVKPITVQLKWKHQFQFAGFYAALEKGFYRRAGFDVTLKPANYDTDPVEEVISGHAHFGLANSELVLYYLQGKPVVALSVIIQHSPIVLMTLKESRIFSPQDLIGKRVMYPTGIYGANTLGIMLREGITKDQFESVPLSFNIDDLINHKVDAMVGYVTDQPYQLQQRNVEYRLLDPRSYGIDFYGDTLFTRQELLEKDPDAVDRFVQATHAGWRYAIENKEEIIDLIINKYHSEKNRDELEFEAEATIELIVPKLVEIGHMNPGRWQHIADTFVDLGMAKPGIALDKFLYERIKIENEQKLLRVAHWVVTVAMILLILFVFLVFINQRLRNMVASRTQTLNEKNLALSSSQKALIEKEQALNQLNQDLEERISERTHSLNEANQALMREVETSKQKEVNLQLLHRAIETSQSAVAILDSDGNFRYVSAGMQRFTGLQPDELAAHSLSKLNTILIDPPQHIEQMILTGEACSYPEIQAKTPGGIKHSLKILVSPMRDDADKISHYVVVFEDISELKANKDKLEIMALYDPLTGLENRTLFNTRLDRAVRKARRNGVKSALLFIDLDHFKAVNDSAGHDAGDQVLITVAQRLKAHVRENDPVARISGDEFTVLLTDMQHYSDAGKIAQKIVEAIKAPIQLDNREVFISASIGVCITPDDTTDKDELTRFADLAMYKAKQAGRNNFRFFSQDMNREVRKRNELEKEIRTALSNEDFYLLYQPQINIETGQICGAEALLRWRLSSSESRLPEEFITVAEETGLIIPLGERILKEALKSLSMFHSKGKLLTLAINLSTRQIQEPDFFQLIESIFEDRKHLIPYVTLEITETAFLGEQGNGQQQIQKLSEMGFSLTLDDFGTGHSSLTYLQRLPFDRVKIAASFIQSLPEEPRSAEITRTIIAMAKNLKIGVIAEGVESKAQADFLVENRCDSAQGFYYARPMTCEALIDTVAQKKGPQ